MKTSIPALPDAFPNLLKENSPDILFVAGEHSGDELSSLIIKEILEAQPECRISAFGGLDMKNAGANLVFNMTTFSAVGFVEVVSNISFYKKLFKLIFNWIKENRPKIICFVDFPGMNLRLAKALKEAGLSKQGGGDILVYHYVSPQIWAWKAGRRFTMAKVLDSLGVLFPFELKCYADTTLDVHFVGDPFANPNYLLPVKYDAEAPVLLLPGSRPKPVARIFPLLMAAWKKFQETHPDKKAVVLHPGEPVLSLLKELQKSDPGVTNIELVPVDSVAKNPQKASAVLMSSGTMSRTCSLAGIPGAITYMANPITWFLGETFFVDRKKLKYLGMANILLNKDVYPEFLQKDATVENLSKCLSECFDNPKILEQMKIDCAELHKMLSPKDGDLNAAKWILNALK